MEFLFGLKVKLREILFSDGNQTFLFINEYRFKKKNAALKNIGLIQESNFVNAYLCCFQSDFEILSSMEPCIIQDQLPF